MDALKDRQVLVTGGAGLIGSRVVRALLERDVAKVIVYDSFVNGSPENLPDDLRIEIIEADVRDFESLRSASEGSDAIVHLAALVSIPESFEEPRETLEVNVTGTSNALEAARRNNISPFVYASSAAVYGLLPQLPKREDMAPDPRSPYALSKLENELAARFYTEAFGLQAVGLRFFNVYDKGQKGTGLLPRWVRAIREGSVPELYGEGSTRDFVHARDAAEAICAALLAAHAASGEVINIGSGQETRVRDTWELLKDASRTELELSLKPMRPGDLPRSVADTRKAKEMLGFTARISLTEGIAELLT